MPDQDEHVWSKHPLPPGWEIFFDEKSQRKYFINRVEKRTTWDDPRIAYYKNENTKSPLSNTVDTWWLKYPLPHDWEVSYDEKLQRDYYINHAQKRTTWDDPRIALYYHEHCKSLEPRTSTYTKNKLSNASTCSSNSSASQEPHAATFEELAHLSLNPSSPMPEFQTELPAKTPSSRSSRTLQPQASKSSGSTKISTTLRENVEEVPLPTETLVSRVSSEANNFSAHNAPSSIRHRSNEMTNKDEALTPLVESIENQYTELESTSSSPNRMQRSLEPECLNKCSIAYRKMSSVLARGPNPNLRGERVSPKGPDASLRRGANADLHKGSNPYLRKGCNPHLRIHNANDWKVAFEMGTA